jgi:hypothetical protein
MQTLLILSVAVFAACGTETSDKATPATTTASTTARPVDACTLLTRDDVVAAMGHKGFSPGKSRDGGMACRFPSALGNSVTVYAQAAPRKQWDELRATLAREGKVGTEVDVPGIGDAAYYWDARLYVHRGSYEVTIHISASRPTPTAADTERDRAAALVMGKRAVERLP